MGLSTSSLQQRCQKFPNVLYFRQQIPTFGPFPKFTSIRKTEGSGLKRVATASVSRRYQITVFFFLHNFQKTLLENVNFDL